MDTPLIHKTKPYNIPSHQLEVKRPAPLSGPLRHTVEELRPAKKVKKIGGHGVRVKVEDEDENILLEAPLQEEAKRSQTEAALVYNFVEVPNDPEEPPQVPLGNGHWTPKTPKDYGQLTRYVCPDSVKLMLPFGPGLMR